MLGTLPVIANGVKPALVNRQAFFLKLSDKGVKEKVMVQLGVNLRKEGTMWVATCKRLNVVAESRMETEALHKAKDAMIVCLRAALRDLENRTSDELETELEDNGNFEDEYPEDEKPGERDLKAAVLRYFSSTSKGTTRSVAKELCIAKEVAADCIEALYRDNKLKKVSVRVYAINTA